MSLKTLPTHTGNRHELYVAKYSIENKDRSAYIYQFDTKLLIYIIYFWKNFKVIVEVVVQQLPTKILNRPVLTSSG